MALAFVLIVKAEALLHLASSDVSQLSQLADVGTSDVTVYATYTDSNGDASAGAATITILYKQN